MEYDYKCVNVEREASVATLFMYWPDGIKREPRTFHRELSEALWKLRHDDEVRVVVLRGAGDQYFLSHFPEEKSEDSVVSRDRYYEIINNSSPAMIDTILRMPKPVIAMVNGDALGIGASIAFACDIIIAAEDAFITDSHMAKHYWSSDADVHEGAVAGDGGAVFWPLNMALCVAKECLMLARPIKAKELFEMHAINRAVPRDELQKTVDEMVKLLLDRPAWALGWTKLALNKRVLQNAELTLHASLALELLAIDVRKNDVDGKGIERI